MLTLNKLLTDRNRLIKNTSTVAGWAKIRNTVSYLEDGKHASDYQGYQNALNLTALA